MRGLKVLIIIIIIISITISLSLAFIGPTEKSTFNSYNKKLKLDDIFIKSNLDIYGESKITLSEDDINIILKNKIKEDDIVKNLPSFITYNDFYLDITDDLVNINSSFKLKFIPLGLNLRVKPIVKDDLLGIKVIKVFLGKIPLPNSVLKFSGLKFDKDTYYFTKSKGLSLGSINKIDINDDKIDIFGNLNSNYLIDQYLNGNKGIKEVINLLGENETSKRFANNLLKFLLINDVNSSTANDLKSILIKDFKSLDRNSKEKLLLSLLKYNLSHIYKALSGK